MFTGEDRPKSEFNMALSYLNRLNSLLIFCNERAINLDLYNWFHALLALKRELNPQMNPKEKQNTNAQIARLTNPITLYVQNQDDRDTVPTHLYQALHELEETLRDVLDRSGLLTKLMDDAGKALR